MWLSYLSFFPEKAEKQDANSSQLLLPHITLCIYIACIVNKLKTHLANTIMLVCPLVGGTSADAWHPRVDSVVSLFWSFDTLFRDSPQYAWFGIVCPQVYLLRSEKIIFGHWLLPTGTTPSAAYHSVSFPVLIFKLYKCTLIARTFHTVVQLHMLACWHKYLPDACHSLVDYWIWKR